MGKIDDAFKFFFFWQKCPRYDCAAEVKREIKAVVQRYQTILSEKLGPSNQHFFPLFIRRIKKELPLQPAFVKQAVL